MTEGGSGLNIIRVDGNSEIGMGHVMRCLSIADAMRNRTIFVTACGECLELIKSRGYRAELLTTDYRDMESELPIWTERLCLWAAEERNRPPVILVDSYQATAEYFAGLRPLGTVACLEDMGVSYPVDMLINYNVYGPELRYAEGLRTLLGVDYIPLRREFQRRVPCGIRPQVENVVITTGGGDPCFAAAGLLNGFMEMAEREGYRNPVFHVISGPVNRYAEKLKTEYGGYPNVRIHENADMREILCESDVVMTASGSTVYEVCALGIPMICFYFADNQRRGAEWLERELGIVNSGNYLLEKEETVRRATAALERCIREFEYREQLARREWKLVDGQGACRIARALEEYGE